MKTKQTGKGVWRTIHGTHVFIRDGESFEDAMRRQFDASSWEDEDYRDKLTDSLISSLTYVDLPNTRFENRKTGERIKPSQATIDYLKNCIADRDYAKSPVDDAIIGCLTNYLREFIVKDYGTSFYKMFDDRITINVSSFSHADTLDSIGHEVGHAIDAAITAVWGKNNSFGVSMNDMLKQETPNIEKFFLETETLKDEMKSLREKYSENQISKKEYSSQYTACYTAYMSLIDTCQCLHGDTKTKEVLGRLGHSEGYFKRYPGAGELFAELTGEQFASSNRYLRRFFDENCPNTMKIYDETMERAKKQWKK